MSSKKFETVIQRDEAGFFFRSLADSVEKGGGLLEEHGIEIQTFSKIKISLRQEGGNLTVRVKVKPLESDGTEEPPSYKRLKKRMKVYFRDILASLEAGSFPSSEIVSVFIHDCESMVTFKGYGDEYYERFSALTRDLGVALESENPEQALQIAKAMEHCKDECHDRYK